MPTTAPTDSHPITPDRVTGLILSGGRGTRVGGMDKGLLPVQGETLITSCAARLAPQVGELIINANRNLADYARLGYRVIGDLRDESLGPLAGIEAGLHACQTEWLISVPCDCPAFPLNLVSEMITALNHTEADIALARSLGKTHPTFAMYHRSLAAHLSAALDAGVRRVSGWQRCHKVLEVTFANEADFVNLNTFDDVAAFEQRPENESENHRHGRQ